MPVWLRILYRIALTGLCGYFLIVVFNILVDPFGMSIVHINIPGFNAAKPMRAHLDRQVKPVDILRLEPRTVFLGSSRIKQAINPAKAHGVPAPVYNAAVDGAGNSDVMAPLVNFILENDPQVEQIYIEVFATAWLSPSGGRGPGITVATTIANRLKSIFSLSGLNYSINTVIANWRGAPQSILDGFLPVAAPPHGYSVRNIPNFFINARVTSGPSDAYVHYIATARQIIEDCRSHGVTCRFILTPLHADALFGVHYVGAWDELVALKEQLAKLAPTYDFLRYGPLIEERSEKPEFWWEAFHFSPALGQIILDVIAGNRNYGNFGVLLTSSNIDHELASFESEFARWYADNPIIQTRYDAAATTYLHPPKNGRIESGSVIIGENVYPMRNGECGKVDNVIRSKERPSMIFGWATNGQGVAASAVAVFADDELTAYTVPNVPRPDIAKGPDDPLYYSGFFASAQIPDRPLRLFSLSDHACEVRLK